MRHLLKSIGPGLLFAGAAIGVSHLVQSTRAGANYGFSLVWVVLLANLLKYPFFEFGPRYAAATGESLLEGYQRLGKWALVMFLVLTFGTMFTVQAAVTLVTAGVMELMITTCGFSSILGMPLNGFTCSIVIIVICMLILMIGRYRFLDNFMKIIIVTLSISTILALIFAISKKGVVEIANPPSAWEGLGITFVIALMGWMPSAIDISVWHSLWTLEKQKQTEDAPDLKDSLLDFNLGYIVTALLAVAFLSLGALIMYGSSDKFPASGAAFTGQFIKLYTDILGSWVSPFIFIAAFTAMFSTTLTVTDGFPRVLQRATKLVFHQEQDKNSHYWGWMIVVCGGAVIIISYFLKNMKQMVDLATVLSFLTAPLLAGLNYRLVTSKHMPQHGIPPLWLRILSWVGILSLTGFSIWYVVFLLG